jgi:hypothetical protein
MKPWSIEECEAYAKQLRDGTRANRAEDAAQAIEYLLSLVNRENYEQPVVAAKTWFDGEKVVTQYLTAKDIYKPEPDDTAPPERKWVGLTEAERVDIIDIEIPAPNDDHWALAQSIEAALKEKNT